ncbi:MAG: 3-hydroxyacyl-CoA dehydrogenase NAD-binding domain-containing protein, partial [Gammaproteobacteria bacterium]
MEINKVGIIGCGTMGLGVAQVCIQSRIDTVAVKATPGSTDKLRTKVEKSLQRIVERGKLEPDARDAALARLRLSTDENDVADCNLVIESVIEDIDVK